MGARGTDVAREAASLVLLNDDFASLVTAVRHGRRVFANLRKAITFVLAVHVPIVGLSILPVLLGWPLVLMPVHILFLQLIIDPACSIVFEAEALEVDAMRQPPRSPGARLFGGEVVARGLTQGVGLLALAAVAYLTAKASTASDDAARAVAFLVLVLGNLALIQVNRRWHRGTTSRNPTFAWISIGAVALLWSVLAVPAVRTLFVFEPVPHRLLAAAVAAAAAAWLWFEAVKWIAIRWAR